MKRYKVGSNKYKKRLTPFGYLKALGFMSFWFLLLAYCFTTGLKYVVIPGITHWSLSTFQVVAYAPTIERAYAQKTEKDPILPTLTPAPTKKDIIFTQKHGDIIYRIYGLESSFGQQPFLFCTRQGKVSDMGYNVLNHECFNSFTEEVQTVEKWLEDHEGISLGKELCLYNQGNPKVSCEYSQNFLTL